jgi:putative oxidoreductase
MSVLRNIFIGGAGGASWLADLGLLLLRVGIGLMLAFGHGILKVPPPDMLVTGLDQMGVPLPSVSAWLVAFAEFGGGILLALGLLTRPAAFLIFFTMCVAVLRAHWADPLFPPPTGGASKEPALLFLIPAAALMLTGAGRYGIDQFLRGRRREPEGLPVA